MNSQAHAELATRAITQSRLLAHQAELAATTARSQAVALLLDDGWSYREIAKLTGMSKSAVSREASTPPPPGLVVHHDSDTRVYDFADEWIWGSPKAAQDVREALATREESA